MNNARRNGKYSPWRPHLDYDEDADVLYVTFGTGEPSYVEDHYDVLIERSFRTDTPTGCRILDLRRRLGLKPSGYSPWRPHHFYWGLVCCIVGFCLLFPLPKLGLLVWLPLEIVGAILIIDDLYQHFRQKSEPGYLSPIHRWWDEFLEWLRRRSWK